MKDWDSGKDFRAAIMEQGEIECRLKSVSFADVRAGGPYLTVRSAKIFNDACDAFFKKRGMPVGRDYQQEILCKIRL